MPGSENSLSPQLSLGARLRRHAGTLGRRGCRTGIRLIAAFGRRLPAPQFVRVRCGQIMSGARYQLAILTRPSAQAHVYAPPSLDWGRSRLIRLARKWTWLARGASAGGRVVAPFRSMARFAGTVAYLALSVSLIAFNSLRVIHNRHAEATDLVNLRSSRGRDPILLFAHNLLLVPDVARVAARLARQPEHVDKVAVIVPNSATEAALKPLTGPATLINMQKFWLDQSIDIANHDLIRRVLDLHTAARSRMQPDRAGSKPHLDLFEAMYMDMHIELLQMLRLGCAMQAALDAGKSTIAVCFGVARWQHGFFRNFLQTPSRGEISSLVTRHIYHHELFATLDPGPSPSEMIQSARARQASDPAKPGENTDRPIVGSTAQIIDRDSRSVALITDSAPESSYWPTVINLALAARQSGRSLRILVESPAAVEALRSEGFVVDEFSLAAACGADQRFREAYAALIDELEATANLADGNADRRLPALQGHLVARFAEPEVGDHVALLNYRIRELIERWMLDHRIGSVVVLPHWGRLAWLAVGVANALGLPSACTPAVTVAGNSASIVGWNWLSLVGCYGLQCLDAFASQGYPAARLQLIGSLALDRATRISREDARKRIKTFSVLARGGRRVLLYGTSGVNRNEREILAELVDLCRDPAANVALVVRPHPSIGHLYYEEALGAALGSGQRVAAVISEGTAHDNIAAADVIITDFSTIGAEAVLIGRPLLVVNTTGRPFPANNYADLGVAVQANSVDEIRPMLQRLVDEGAFWSNAQASREAFTNAYNWGGDGKAGVRLLDGLEELACRAQAQAQRIVVPTCHDARKAVEGAGSVRQAQATFADERSANHE